MNSIRVLLAVEPRLLRDALGVYLTRQSGLTVAYVASQTLDVLIGAREHGADVVVLTIEPTSGVPPVVTHLLGEFPEIVVLAIELAHERARVFRYRTPVRTLRPLSAAAIIRTIIRCAAKNGKLDDD